MPIKILPLEKEWNLFEQLSSAVSEYVLDDCQSPGCKGRREVTAYCGNCYASLRRSGELIKKTGRLRISTGHLWLIGAASYQGEDCLIWPFCETGGYGVSAFKGQNFRVHIISCVAANGRRPSVDHVAAHNCGTSLCCNPRHLSWKTQKDNIADKVIHGTALIGEKHHQSKLTELEVREIRSLRGKITRKQMTVKYGVKISTIDNVLDGVTWRSVA